MAQTYFSSHRAALLASVAGLAIAGVASNASAQTAFVNTTVQTGTTSFFTLGSGDSLTNTATGSLTITSGGGAPAVLTGALGAAFILNSGTIQSQQDPGGIAISVATNTSLGTITNSGTGLIQTNGVSASSVMIAGSLGQLLNSATIAASGASGAGVNVVSGGSVGAVTNSLGGTIASSGSLGSAILVSGGTITSLTNNGSILASGPNGNAVNITAGQVGTMVNGTTGTIAATGSNGIGLNILTTVGNVVNQGTISGSGANGQGIDVGPGALVPFITNAATGTISADGTNGVGVNISGVVLSLVNQGLVNANGAGGVGINVVTGASVGTVTNSGTVQANGGGGTGVAVNGSVTAVNNSSLIQANGPGGTGLSVGLNGTLQSLTNLATGTIQATGLNGVGVNDAGNLGTINNAGLIQGGPANGSGTAINLTGALSQVTVNNTGSVVGAITLGQNATVNLNAGTVTGNIGGTGDSEVNTVVNFNGGTVSAGFTVQTVAAVNVNAGTLTIDPTTGVTVTNVTQFSILSGATVNLNGSIGISEPGDPGVINGGLLSLGPAGGTITGAYTQTATGQLGIPVGPTGAPMLNVLGTAVINSTGPAVVLNFGTNTTGPNSFVAINATGGITATQPLTATSNSLNLLFDFPLVTLPNANTLLISFAVPTLQQINTLYCTLFCGSSGGPTSTGGFNQTFAIGAVQTLFDTLYTNGNQTAMVNAFATLRALTPAQQVQFFTQVQPNQVTSGAALLASALTGNGGLTTAVDDRLYGMAAGDEIGRALSVWVRPYGEAFTQGRKENVDGFNSGMYGIAAGADIPIRPDVRLGGAMSLSNTNINFTGLQSGNTATDLLFQAGIYGSYFSGNFFLDGIGAFGLHWYDTKEAISAFGLQRTASYSGVQFSGKVTGGYDWHATPNVVVTPSLAFEEIHIDSGAHQTSGGGLFDLNVASQSLDSMQLKLGSRVAYPMPQTSGWTFTPEVHAYYVRNLIRSRVHTTASFVSGGSFTVAGPQRDADLVDLGLGVTIAQKGPFGLSARYDYVWGQTSSDNQFFLRAKTEF